MVRMALAALALSGVCQRYRSMYHALSRVTSGGGAASLLAVAGRIACKDARLCAAFACPWPPSSRFYTLREIERGTYARLAEGLRQEQIASLRLSYRSPNVLHECILDVLLGSPLGSIAVPRP